MKAIFLDRDDTIIKDKNYMHKVEDLDFFEDTKEALQIMQQKGFELFLVTNQSGIGRGMFEEKDMHTFHQAIQDQLKAWSLKPFRDIKFCPDHPDQASNRRKPNPGMLLELIEEFNLNPHQCYMVGDKTSDVEAAVSANVHPIIVRKKINGYPFFENLIDFAQFL